MNKLVLLMLVATMLTACQPAAPAPSAPPISSAQATLIPPTSAPTSVPTSVPTVEPTPTFEPEARVSTIEGLIGVWQFISQPGSVKAQLTFLTNGQYSGKAVEGQFAGTTLDSGKFWLDGPNLSLQTDGKCQNAKGDMFDCVGVYEVYLTRQAGKPLQLRFITVDDKYSSRRSDLTRAPLLWVGPQ